MEEKLNLFAGQEEEEAFGQDLLKKVEKELLKTVEMIDTELKQIDEVIQLASKASPGLYSVKSSLLGLRIDTLKKIGDFVFDKKKMESADSLSEVKDITQLIAGMKK